MQHWWISGFMVASLLMSGTAHAATLGIPGPHTTLSGIGVVSGWKCDAGELTVRFNGGEPLPLSYGSERQDVLDAGACDHAEVGFVSIMNWGELGDGQHTAVVYDDGVEFDRSTFNVVTTGEAFLEGAVGQCVVDDFPVPGEDARFLWHQSTQHLELVEVQPDGPLPSAQERPDLYMPPEIMPRGMTHVSWIWSEVGSPHQESIEIDFTIHNNVDDWSDRHGLYLILAQSNVSGTGFYFGLQTDMYRYDGPTINTRKGVIFSRWETRDLAHTRVAPGGWNISSGAEGNFIGVRRPYEWSAGAYRARLARYDSDRRGDWYGLWITDVDRGRTTWMGALWFPRVDGQPTELGSSFSSHIEIYGSPLRLINIPEWHVSLKAPLGDIKVTPAYADTRYQYDIPNTDISYHADENAVHMRIGGDTQRQTLQPGDYNRYWLPTVE